MPVTLATNASAPADDYLALIRRFPLRPIRDDAEYDTAAAVLESLSVRRMAGKALSADETGYADVLAMLIRDYDERAGNFEPAGTLPERMQALIDASEGSLNQSRIAEIVGASRGNVADVMRGRRGWSKAQIRTLSEHFKLRAEYFLD